jgi:hypothetical protein
MWKHPNLQKKAKPLLIFKMNTQAITKQTQLSPSFTAPSFVSPSYPTPTSPPSSHLSPQTHVSESPPYLSPTPPVSFFSSPLTFHDALVSPLTSPVHNYNELPTIKGIISPPLLPKSLQPFLQNEDDKKTSSTKSKKRFQKNERKSSKPYLNFLTEKEILSPEMESHTPKIKRSAEMESHTPKNKRSVSSLSNAKSKLPTQFMSPPKSKGSLILRSPKFGLSRQRGSRIKGEIV